MFSLEAERIINHTWSIIGQAMDEKKPVMPLLEENELSTEMIEDATSSYLKVKARKPDVFARALLLRSNLFEIVIELSKVKSL